MGSACSLRVKPRVHPILKCPQDYDPNKFKKICVLFDQLDKDSNFGVSSHELGQISQLHVSNCIRRLEMRQTASQQDHTRRLSEIEADTKREVQRVQNESTRSKDSATEKFQQQHDAVVAKIQWYQGLDEDARGAAFMQAVMPADQDYIDFWSFFRYMRTRTADIDNLPCLGAA